MPSREVKKNGQSVDKKAESDRAKAYVSNGYAVQNHESDHFLFQKPFCSNKKQTQQKSAGIQWKPRCPSFTLGCEFTFVGLC